MSRYSSKKRLLKGWSDGVYGGCQVEAIAIRLAHVEVLMVIEVHRIRQDFKETEKLFPPSFVVSIKHCSYSVGISTPLEF